MPLVRRPPVVPLAAAALLAAGIGGVSLADSPKKTPASAAGVAAPRADGWGNWSVAIDGGQTVEVRARRCPKQHPRKVGSFSYSTTRIINGKVEHHSAKGSVCAK